MIDDLPAAGPTPAVVFDVREEIAHAPIDRYHLFLAALVGVIVFFEGYDTFNASYVIHYVMGPWHLQPGSAGLLVSSGIVGFSVAAIFQGKVSDVLGRRTALIGALWIATLFSFATAVWARGFWMFCAMRFLTGIGLGVLLPVSVAYMAECAPRASRSRFATWSWSLGFSLGGVAASAVGVFLTPVFGWQSLYFIASASVGVAVACHIWLPESVQYLAMRSRSDEIALLLGRLRPARAAIYQQSGATFVLHEPRDRIASFRELLTPRHRRTTLASWGAAFCVLFAVYGLTSWAPTVMIARGETLASSFGFGAVILGMNFVGTLACGVAIDRFGLGRSAPAFCWLLGGTATAALAFASGHLMNTSAMVLAGFGILGGQGALNNLTATWYDTQIRGTAVGTMLGVGRLGAVLGPYVVGLLQQRFGGSGVVFLSIGIAAIAGGLIISLAAPPQPDPHAVTAR